MTRDEIIRLAREAATEDGSVNRSDGKNIVIYAAKTSLFLERFAALVAAAEREACAMEAEYEAARWPYAPECREPCEEIAAAIRARGETK